MNSIRRARVNPRVESVCFCSLWWVLLREAAYRVIATPWMTEAEEQFWRTRLSDSHSWEVHRMVERVLAAWPGRAVRP